MDPDLLNILGTGLVFFGWLVIPLVPAVILYKLVKETDMDVEGVLAAIRFRASGPVALYLLLVYFGQPLATSALPGTTVWTVVAPLATDGSQVEPVVWLKPMHDVGFERCEFKVVGSTSEFEGWDELGVEIPGGEARAIRFVDLVEGEDYEINWTERTVELKEPIPLMGPESFGDSYDGFNEATEVTVNG